jgi:hypothetical protein
VSYTDLSKNGPHKKHCAWAPTPPPWRKVKIYRFLTIFCVFGAFNRAGKSVSKIGIYALPPLKSDFYSILLKIGSKFIANFFASVSSFHTYTKISANENSFSVLVLLIFCFALCCWKENQQSKTVPHSGPFGKRNAKDIS